MKRFLSAFINDCRVQWRNRLYHVGIVAAVVTAVPLSQLVPADQMHKAVAAVMLLVVGGTALLYVSAMILFERDEGTLSALVASPLTISEYLWSKTLSVTVVAVMEAVLIVVFVMASQAGPVALPDIAVAFVAIASISVMFVFIGIALVVRFQRMTNFFIPMGALVTVLQLPVFHFTGLYENPFFLFIPSSAPTMLMTGAYLPLSGGQWIYAIGYTLFLLIVLYIWAYRAFVRHIVERAG